MKKSIIYSFFMIGILLVTSITIGTVKAAGLIIGGYNGSSNGPAATSGGCPPLFKQGQLFCRYNLWQGDNNRRGIRISFIYYDGSSYEQLGRSLDIWPTTIPDGYSIKSTGYNNNNKVMTGPLNYASMQNFTSYSITSKIGGGVMTSGSRLSSVLKEIFLNENNLVYYSEGLTGCSIKDPNCHVWDRPSEPAVLTGTGDITKKGYRLFIEPLTLYAANPKSAAFGYKNDFFIMTPTELVRYLDAYSYLNGKGAYYYAGDEELLFTDYDDVGIHRTRPCGNNISCFRNDMKDKSIGHALQIIDFTKFLDQECDYETGKGFPTSEADRKDEGKMKCCEEELNKIIEETIGKKTEDETKKCMATSKTTAEFAVCMGNAVANKFGTDPNQELEKRLNEFYEKYPYCKGDCEEEIKKMITDPYQECRDKLTAIEKIKSNMAAGSNCEIYTTCEIQLVTNANQFIKSHKDCIYANALLECEYDPNKEDPSEKPICDENNPNHFPSSPTDTKNRECCEYFEEKIKQEATEEALKQGKTKDQAKAYAEQKAKEWIEATEYRKNCLKGECNIDDDKLTEACCDELKADPKYKNKPDSFWEAKGCPVDKGKCECTYTDYEVDNIERTNGQCAGDHNLLLSDTNDWECIFYSPSLDANCDSSMFKDYYVVFNNPVCAVYCREEVQYNFPDGTMLVNAGHHFTVNGDGKSFSGTPNWSPIKFTSTRECRTGPSAGSSEYGKGTEYVIPWQEYSKTWEEENKQIMEDWDSWNEDYWSSTQQYRATTGSCCTSYSCGRYGGSCCSATYTYQQKVQQQILYTRYTGEVVDRSLPGWVSSSPGVGSCPQVEEDPRLPYLEAPGGYHGNYKAGWESMRKRMDQFEQTQEDYKSCTDWSNFYTLCNGGTCGGRVATFSLSHTNVTATRFAKYTSYDEFLKYYEFSPDVSIQYEDQEYNDYNYEDLLVKSDPKYTNSTQASTGTEHHDEKFNKTRSGCIDTRACSHSDSYNLYQNDNTLMTLTKMYTYNLKPNVFDTIMKPQGVAINSANKMDDPTQEYVDLGYSALHVHYMRKSGRYPIALYYPTFTPQAEYNEQMPASNIVHNFDQFLEPGNQVQECSYQVKNKIVEEPFCEDDICEPLPDPGDCLEPPCIPKCDEDDCTPKGLYLLFRPISLYNPFPGVEGTGRQPGTNWQGQEERFIYNNRGVKGEKIYFEKEPMYEITLTPALIKEIRKYNDTTTYSDYHLDCIDNVGTECKSAFIRGGLDYNEYDFSKLFKGCGTKNWHDCDNLDGIVR